MYAEDEMNDCSDTVVGTYNVNPEAWNNAVDSCQDSTAKRILERRGIQTSSSFVKIWLVCIPEFKANFLFLWHLYGLVFYLESIGVH